MLPSAALEHGLSRPTTLGVADLNLEAMFSERLRANPGVRATKTPFASPVVLASLLAT